MFHNAARDTQYTRTKQTCVFIAYPHHDRPPHVEYYTYGCGRLFLSIDFQRERERDDDDGMVLT